MSRSIACVFLFCAALNCTPALVAQSNELAFAAGGQLSFHPHSNVGSGFVLEGSYARRLAHVPTISLYVELPIAAAFNVSSELPSQIVQRDYDSLFIAPGFKLKLIPEAPISPFFTAGYGWARFRQDATATTPEFVTDTDVAQFGAGVDFKIAPYVGIRTEVRDYFSGPLNFNGSFDDRQHNLAAVAGIALRF
jgi:hypothetical protein